MDVNPSLGIPGVAQASIGGGASIAFDDTAALTLRVGLRTRSPPSATPCVPRRSTP